MKLAELVSALADAKMQAAEIQETIIAKDAQIRELEERLTVKEQLKYEAPSYWIIRDQRKRARSFCQSCSDIRTIG